MFISNKRLDTLSGVFLALHLMPISYFLWRIGPTMPLDAQQYLDLARNLLANGTLGWNCDGVFGPESVRMPGYSALIALIFAVFGNHLWPIVLLQSVLFLASVALIWRAGSRVFGATTGTVFLLISAPYPFVAFWAVNIMTEICCVFLVALSIYFLTKSGTKNLMFGSIPIVLATYFRPNLILLGIFVGGCAFLLTRFKERRMLLVLILVTIVGMSPWAIRNYATFGVASPLPIVKGTGLSLFISTWQGRVSTETLVTWGSKSEFTREAIESGFYDQIEEIKRKANLRLSDGDRVEVLSLLEKCDSNEKKAAIEAEMMSAAFENIGKHPVQFVYGAASNTVRMWVTVYGLRDLPVAVQYLLIFQGLIIVILGWVGIVFILRTGNIQRLGPAVFVAVIMYFLLTFLILHTEARYTIPARLPLLLVAAFGAVEISKMFGFSKIFKISEPIP